MANEMIRKNMILTGVSISELADRLGVTDDEMVVRLNRDMGIMENFKVMSAITEIARGKGQKLLRLNVMIMFLSVG